MAERNDERQEPGRDRAEGSERPARGEREERPFQRADRGGERGDRGDDRGPRGGRRPRRHRGKVCQFTVEKINYIDYKDIDRLRNYISDSGKILPRRITGTSARHQRMLAVALKRARYMALLPFKVR